MSSLFTKRQKAVYFACLRFVKAHCNPAEPCQVYRDWKACNANTDLQVEFGLFYLDGKALEDFKAIAADYVNNVTPAQSEPKRTKRKSDDKPQLLQELIDAFLP